MEKAAEQDRSAAPEVQNRVEEAPLCVDLDGTLMASDATWESIILLARKKPLDLLLLPGWVLKGRAFMKDQLAQRVIPDVAMLPYRCEVVEFVRAEKQAGRRTVLATASHERIAKTVAEHLGIFDDIVASNASASFKSHAKLAELERRYGKGTFDYVGDTWADLCLWKAARKAYVVSASPGIAAAANAVCTPARVFDGRRRRGAWFKAMRPHQWVKNLLLFIPLILAHRMAFNFTLALAGSAFAAFSLCASAVYVLNDLLDIESDRHHAYKCKRPLAAGQWSIPSAMVAVAALIVISFTLACFINRAFVVWLLIYAALTTAYSFWLKRKLLIDVILLSGLYTLRIVAGAAAVHIPPTMWLLAFSMFFFLSLAFAKRYSELIQVEDSGEEEIHGRGYQVRDLRVIESIGPASGYLAVLVFCNYLDSDMVRKLHHHPNVLWMVAPVLLYWITRIWFIARRRQLHDDPIIFAIRDQRSYVCGALIGVILIIASTNWTW